MANKKRQTGITPKMVREARGERTQAACAELIGVTPRQIWQYERGACDIKVNSYNLLMMTKPPKYNEHSHVVSEGKTG